MKDKMKTNGKLGKKSLMFKNSDLIKTSIFFVFKSDNKNIIMS